MVRSAFDLLNRIKGEIPSHLSRSAVLGNSGFAQVLRRFPIPIKRDAAPAEFLSLYGSGLGSLAVGK